MKKQSKTHFERLGIVGAGTMGSGIALTALRVGLAVVLYDISSKMLENARSYIKKHLARKDQADLVKNLRSTSKIEELAGVEVVIEAALEDFSLKKGIFQHLAHICAPPAILASNTSTLPITSIAAVTGAPQRVAGMHFFNPAPVMPLVEIIRGAQTAEDTVTALTALARQMKKTPVHVQDTPGFLVNRAARPFYGEALRLRQEGAATIEQIDAIIELGGHFRMGPFKLMDLIGIDINFTVMKSVYEQSFNESRFRPSLIQLQRVQANTLGQKTRHGFYQYTASKALIDTFTPPPMRTTSGRVLVSNGSWAPGLTQLITVPGYEVIDSPQDSPDFALITAGRAEGLRETLQRYDNILPPATPLLCQCVDTCLYELATWMKHPERLVGFDSLFFASGPAATLVASPTLAPDIKERVTNFVSLLGRLPFWLSDSPALVLPRLIAALVNEAAFMVLEGIAEPETIDTGLRLGVRYPRGPFEWAEEIGFAKILAILDHLWEEFHEERYRAAPFLRRLVRAEKVKAISHEE